MTRYCLAYALVANHETWETTLLYLPLVALALQVTAGARGPGAVGSSDALSPHGKGLMRGFEACYSSTFHNRIFLMICKETEQLEDTAHTVNTPRQAGSSAWAHSSPAADGGARPGLCAEVGHGRALQERVLPLLLGLPPAVDGHRSRAHAGGVELPFSFVLATMRNSVRVHGAT